MLRKWSLLRGKVQFDSARQQHRGGHVIAQLSDLTAIIISPLSQTTSVLTPLRRSGVMSSNLSPDCFINGGEFKHKLYVMSTVKLLNGRGLQHLNYSSKSKLPHSTFPILQVDRKPVPLLFITG